jgi:hypothetical protein
MALLRPCHDQPPRTRTGKPATGVPGYDRIRFQPVFVGDTPTGAYTIPASNRTAGAAARRSKCSGTARVAVVGEHVMGVPPAA